MLLLLQGLINERAGDEDLKDLAAVPVEAHLLDVVHGDRLPVDQRSDTRPRGRLRRIVEHVVDGRRVLQFLENLARSLATLSLSQFLRQLRADLLEGRPGRRQMAFALDHDELISHLHHVGDLPWLEREGCPVELRITGVQADRLHPAVGAGATDVDRTLTGDRTELVGGLERLLPQGVGLRSRPRDDDPRLHGRTKPVLVGLLQLLSRGFDRAAGETAEREHRPDDVVGVLLGRDAPLLLDHLQPLIAGHAEPTGHRVDFAADILGRHRQPVLLAGLLDDPSVDEGLEDGSPVATEAVGGQVVRGDLDAVDDGHRLGSWSDGRRGGGGSGRRGPGFEAAGEQSPAHAHGYDRRCGTNLADIAPVDPLKTHVSPPWRSWTAGLLPDRPRSG